MAEAHQGVAFTFSVTEDEGLHVNVSFEAFKAVLLSGARSWRKMFARLINQILNGVYPSHPLRGIALVGVVTGLKKYKRIDVSFGIISLIQNKLPSKLISSEKSEIAACALFASSAWLSMVVIRKYSLQALFSYHGWMHNTRKSPSLGLRMWMFMVKLMVGSHPRLFSYQNSMPCLPVPNLCDTIERYLRTVRPLLDDENYKRIEEEAVQFRNGVGRRLQRYLIFKSWISSNYVSDWWEEYVYLRGRSPIMVNSNFYALDSVFRQSTKIQAARAANCITAAFMYRRLLDNEDLEPILVQDLIPLCSRQYDRQFNTTRIPGEVTDQIVHYKDSKHVAVYNKGKWFKLYTYYRSQNLNAKELELQIERILEDDSTPLDAEKYLAALTAGDRVPWAQARKKFFSRGQNKASLNAIEKAAFVVILDEEEYAYLPNENRELDAFARSMLHGKGYDRWFDKSFNMIITKNGRIGLNTEHSWADAPVTGHMWESVIADEVFKIGYDDDGHSKGTIRYDLPEPIRLKWEFTPRIEGAIMASYKVAHDLLNDVDLHIYVHDVFGKGFIKTCRLSPDAFIQMALQLAYYRDIGRHHLTYEASMTRLFREGRTETVRSCSVESCNWVKSMIDDQVTNTEKLKLLKKACDFHVNQYRDAMTGKGVDRHIFCLYVVSKYLEIDTPFLKEVLSEPWRLSTSQTPASQTNKIDLKAKPEFISAGGGFGPVADDGYGVSYIITGEDMIFFHISSKKSSDKTDSFRFGQNIKQAMLDMKQLFETEKQNNPKK